MGLMMSCARESLFFSITVIHGVVMDIYRTLYKKLSAGICSIKKTKLNSSKLSITLFLDNKIKLYTVTSNYP